MGIEGPLDLFSANPLKVLALNQRRTFESHAGRSLENFSATYPLGLLMVLLAMGRVGALSFPDETQLIPVGRHADCPKLRTTAAPESWLARLRVDWT